MHHKELMKELAGTLLLFFIVLLAVVVFCLLPAKVSEAQDADMAVDEAAQAAPSTTYLISSINR